MEYDFVQEEAKGVEDEDLAGAAGSTNTEGVRKWLGADEDDVGYRNWIENVTVCQMLDKN